MNEQLWCDWESTRKAFAVAKELNQRIAMIANEQSLDCPGTEEELLDACQATVVVTENTLSISLGSEVVWSDQCDSSEDLTADYCLEEFARVAMPMGWVANAIAAEAAG